ncbi:DNA phosphorothioation system sulfurtransferase DndC [Methylicorpusculum sp.]|uniref:DNA phosphorothioation system sulfurtransferase DndC n=1 Tax=Methylicorpusculum sp. TaxID=2713644 RepID=UPI002731CA9F|nr:DNA phosphorothioation system sulfurtransferase DndC [Methylicorpusculum sp.]MDP2180576.1 DNA phosphorothioation system sulfurtransferase DndC [Methylicorpusculum sp.]MDP3527736.1 DNA phosphorothioation system sulfurtransferase DndC [Methylicorpusculum sp.]
MSETIAVTEDNQIENHEGFTKYLLRENFLADNRPWVIAYSGGKDSTLVLQLVYEMLLTLTPEQQKPVHIVSSDTRVEAPNIEEYLENSLMQLEQHARTSRLDLSVHLVKPEIENSFWSLIIGKGYPPPNRWFRWCTTKLKIKPVRKVIDEITSGYGSVILLIGTRKAESSNRSRQIDNRQYNSRGLNQHTEIPNALVLQPIVHWTTDEVWEYLFTHNPAPWNFDHDRMLALYRQANSGECPVITDLDTPSCGGSRFGCWTCTVVKEDKSMKGFIETGDEWMEPLYDFRIWLRDLHGKEELRNQFRRNDQPGLGPFNSEARKMILEKLLKTEQTVGKQLISNEELLLIQEVWTKEFDVMHSALRIAHKYNRKPKGVVAA